MAVPIKFIKLEDVRLELLLAPPVSLSECIASAGKTGLWNRLGNFAGYAKPYCSVSPSSLSHSSSLSSKTVTITSNTNWLVSDNASWVSISGASGIGNDTFTVTCQANTGNSRSAIVTVAWSGTNRTISIYQSAGSGGGDECLQP